MVDFRWMSNGGLLIDGTGDIACTPDDRLTSLQDVVRSRIKAALRGWKLYPVGADLQARVGDTVSAELEITLQQQVYNSLTADNLLPRGSFTVKTLAYGTQVHVLIYIQQQLVAQAVLQKGKS
jgi:hypothetical protein